MLASLYAPPGMTWKETLTDSGTHVYFSGTGVAAGPRVAAWFLLFSGIFFFVIINFGGPLTGSIVLAEAIPIAIFALGATLAYKWRLGGPSAGVLDVVRVPSGSELRMEGTLTSGPQTIAASEIADIVVSDNEQEYRAGASVEFGSSYGAPRMHQATSRWYQVIVIKKDGDRRIVACFGERACAVFFGKKLLEMLGLAMSTTAV